MTNTPAGPREIQNKPIDLKKRSIFEKVINSERYKKGFKTFNEQLAYIHETAKKYGKDHKTSITHRDLSHIFNISKTAITNHIHLYEIDKEREAEGKIPRKNGRPFTLSQSEIIEAEKYLKSQELKSKFSKFKQFCEEKFGKQLEYPTYIALLGKLGYRLVLAKPIEDTRYFVSEESLNNFYDELEIISHNNNIPSAFCWNLDEEGHDEFADSREEYIIIEDEDNNKKEIFYPVDRKSDHATFLAAINAYGDFVKPLIVAKRATVEAELLMHNLGPVKLMLR